MSIAILELNDVCLLAHQDGHLLLESPGYVTVENRHALIGQASLEKVKQKPLLTEYRFWHRLGMDVLDQSNTLARTQADLAFMHLQDCWHSLKASSVEELLLVVPGDIGRDQLGLLLGMCKRLEMPVRALVDAAVAGSGTPAPGRRLFHLDMHLHRCVLSELDQSAWLSRVESHTSNEVGLLRLREAWGHVASGLFVQATRFDPQHNAEVEQSLFDQMLHWHQLLSKHEHVDVDLNHGGRSYRIRLHRRHIVTAAEPVYRRLREFIADALPRSKAVTLQVSAAMAALPGLLDCLEALPDTEVVVLDRLSAQAGVERLYLGRQTAQEEVPYVTRCPWFNANDVSSHKQLLDGYQRRQATHLLHHAVAYPLVNGRFAVGTEPGDGQPGIRMPEQSPGVIARHFCLQDLDGQWVLEDFSDGATVINDEQISGSCEVAVGDRIRIGNPGTEFMLIAVDDKDGD